MKLFSKKIAAFGVILCLFMSACTTSNERFVSNKTSQQQAAIFNTKLGINYMREGDFQSARDKLDKALEQDGKNAQTQIAYALLQQRVGQNEIAKRYYREAIRLDPDNPDYMNNYGAFLCSQGDVKAAMKNFENASNQPFYKTPELALDNAGVCAFDHRQFDLAESYFRAALKKNPRTPSALLHMAELSLELERIDIANNYWQLFNQFTQPSAQSLYLGVLIHKAFGNTVKVRELSQELVKKFPSSAQTSQLLKVGT